MTSLTKSALATLAGPALLALAACGGEAPTPPAPADDAVASAPETPAASGEAAVEGPVTVDGAFIQEPPAGRDVLLAGVTLLANGQDLRLVEVQAPIAERVEMHTMATVDGQMTMGQVEAVDLPAGIPVTLKGGGDHLMLFGVENLDVTGTYPMTLTVEDADGEQFTVDVEATVRPLGG